MYATNPSDRRAGAPRDRGADLQPGDRQQLAVTMKRYRVGEAGPPRGAFASAPPAPPPGPAPARGDSGGFKFFAGPASVPAPPHFVRWSGSATLLMPKNFMPRGYFNSALKSKFRAPPLTESRQGV